MLILREPDNDTAAAAVDGRDDCTFGGKHAVNLLLGKAPTGMRPGTSAAPLLLLLPWGQPPTYAVLAPASRRCACCADIGRAAAPSAAADVPFVL